MANFKKLRWYLDRWNDVLLDARGMPVRRIDVTRSDIYNVELQVFDGGQFAVDSSGIILPANAVDLSAYTDIVLGIKSQAKYLADGDFDFALAGFDLTNPMHDPTAGGVAMLGWFPSTPADYYGELQLRTTSGQPLTAVSRPTVLHLHRQVIIGSEASMPSGVTAVLSGTATISGTNTSVAVSVAGLTATGQVILGFGAPTGTPSAPFYWETYAAGAFTINVDVAPGAGNAFNFRWTLVRLS